MDTCISNIFKFMHRVMYLELDETEYYDDGLYDMSVDDEEVQYENHEGQS